MEKSACKNFRRSGMISLIMLILVACIAPPRSATPGSQVSKTQIQAEENLPGLDAQAGEALFTPDPSLTPLPSPTLPGTTTPTPSPRPSAIVIVFDAGGAGLVYQAMAAGKLSHFSDLARRGLRAEYAQSVDPSLSAPAQVSLVTGAYPGRTGIVSNAFHNASDDFYWYRVGFDEPMDQAEPVWVTASRQGLTTAALFIAGAKPDLPAQAADYTIGYGIRDAYSRQVDVPLTVSTNWQDIPPTYSPALAGYFHIPSVARIDVLVIDSSDDEQVNYDRVLMNSDAGSTTNRASEEALILEAGEWGPLTILPNITAGADFLLQEITPNHVKLYHTGVYHNTASPPA